MQTATQQQAKVDMLNALGELRARLYQINVNMNLIRSDVLGEGEATDEPERIPVQHLDGKIFELYPIVDGIEHSISRLMDRIGVRVNTPAAPKPSRSAANY
jgi:hypothetical protein